MIGSSHARPWLTRPAFAAIDWARRTRPGGFSSSFTPPNPSSLAIPYPHPLPAPWPSPPASSAAYGHVPPQYFRIRSTSGPTPQSRNRYAFLYEVNHEIPELTRRAFAAPHSTARNPERGANGQERLFHNSSPNIRLEVDNKPGGDRSELRGQDWASDIAKKTIQGLEACQPACLPICYPYPRSLPRVKEASRRFSMVFRSHFQDAESHCRP